MKVQLTKRLGQNHPGSVIELTDIQAEHLVRRGAAVHIEQSHERVEIPREDETEHVETLDELRERARNLGLKTGGNARQIRARIDKHLAAERGDPE